MNLNRTKKKTQKLDISIKIPIILKLFLKNLPATIENRQINLSKNKNIFDDNICTYQNA